VNYPFDVKKLHKLGPNRQKLVYKLQYRQSCGYWSNLASLDWQVQTGRGQTWVFPQNKGQLGKTQKSIFDFFFEPHQGVILYAAWKWISLILK
jgi:hypothetical protein